MNLNKIFQLISISECKQEFLDMIAPSIFSVVKIYCFAHKMNSSSLKEKCKNLISSFLRYNIKSYKIVKSLFLPQKKLNPQINSKTKISLFPGEKGFYFYFYLFYLNYFFFIFIYFLFFNIYFIFILIILFLFIFYFNSYFIFIFILFIFIFIYFLFFIFIFIFLGGVYIKRVLKQ